MKKFLLPIGAAVILTVSPAYADVDSETHVEERVENNGIDGRRSERTVETEHESDLGSKTTQRKETVESNDGDVKTKVHESTEKHVDDDD